MRMIRFCDVAGITTTLAINAFVIKASSHALKVSQANTAWTGVFVLQYVSLNIPTLSSFGVLCLSH